MAAKPPPSPPDFPPPSFFDEVRKDLMRRSMRIVERHASIIVDGTSSLGDPLAQVTANTMKLAVVARTVNRLKLPNKPLENAAVNGVKALAMHQALLLGRAPQSSISHAVHDITAAYQTLERLEINAKGGRATLWPHARLVDAIILKLARKSLIDGKPGPTERVAERIEALLRPRRVARDLKSILNVLNKRRREWRN